MAKLKTVPVGIDGEGRKILRICEGSLGGKDVAGDFVLATPGQHSMGQMPAEISMMEDGHVAVDVIEAGQKLEFEDRSKKRSGAGKGPAKANSDAFRSGWDRAFSN